MVDRLDPASQASLGRLVEMLTVDPSAPSAVRSATEAWRVHVADSLSALELEPLASSRRIADVGAGAGLPGLALALALPDASVDLVESISRKCDFARRAIESAGIERARVICRRAEDLATAAPPEGGREAYDAVTARAVGRLATVAELASPLLVPGGVVVVWKGRRDADEEAELARAAKRLAIESLEVRAAAPYAGSRHRHLHLLRKSGPTPADLPRRAGMAKKRPLGA